MVSPESNYLSKTLTSKEKMQGDYQIQVRASHACDWSIACKVKWRESRVEKQVGSEVISMGALWWSVMDGEMAWCHQEAAVYVLVVMLLLQPDQG